VWCEISGSSPYLIDSAYTAEEESRAALGAGGYQVVECDSVPGYKIDHQYDSIAACVNGPQLPSTLILELGTNDALHSNAAAFVEAESGCVRALEGETHDRVEPFGRQSLHLGRRRPG